MVTAEMGLEAWGRMPSGAGIQGCSLASESGQLTRQVRRTSAVPPIGCGRHRDLEIRSEVSRFSAMWYAPRLGCSSGHGPVVRC
jgi:hypothetical protein